MEVNMKALYPTSSLDNLATLYLQIHIIMAKLANVENKIRSLNICVVKHVF